MRLLLIEDDAELANGLVHALAQSGHACDAAANGQAALSACAVTAYDLVVLDLGLPDVDGQDLLRQLRERGLAAPVLILTARDDVHERIRGLDGGADDYLAKPFALGELEARIRALLRRGQPSSTQLAFGRLQFDTATRCASVGGESIDLTARELAILELLLRRAGRVVGKQQLFDAIYTWEADANLSVIEVHVSRLRRKLETASAGVVVRMLRGLGYRLETGRDD
ncbi:response regulator transcription factor [Dokdonella sp.]|uniref:response regulator n=1 Tax=Dokdonella sp. TaxID=2291710 RepID=UPI00260CF67D|nr:response regulator transcription factor [Dokdonella sp.]